MIVIAGESLVDVVVLPDGSSSEAVGGSPLNVAVGLGRLDVPTTLVTQLGDDARGDAVRRHLADSDVELEATVGDAPTAVALARVGPDGAASYEFEIAWAPQPPPLPQSDALHVGSLGLLLEPGRQQVLDLVEQAYAREVFVSFDPNLRRSFIDDHTQTWRDLEAVAERCSLVKLSDEDARLLHPDADPGDIARSLLSDRTELVLLTRGADGATAYAAEGAVTVAGPAITVVDTVGAGDSFMSATLAALYDAQALSAHGPGLPHTEEGMRRLLNGAVTVAAITCSRRGADPPRRSELPADWPG